MNDIKIITFILSNIASFQLYVPLFQIYNNNEYEIRLLLRDNIMKKYATPIGKEKQFTDIIEKYNVKTIKLQNWLDDGGMTYCVDGDTMSNKYMGHIESYIINLIGPMQPEERKRFFIVS